MQHYEDDRLSEALFGDGTRLYIDTEDLGDGTTAARLAKYDETGEIASVSMDIDGLQGDQKSLQGLFVAFLDIESNAAFYEDCDFAYYLSSEANRAHDFSPEFIRKAQENYKDMLRIAEKLEEMIPKGTLAVLWQEAARAQGSLSVEALANAALAARSPEEDLEEERQA